VSAWSPDFPPPEGDGRPAGWRRQYAAAGRWVKRRDVLARIDAHQNDGRTSGVGERRDGRRNVLLDVLPDSGRPSRRPLFFQDLQTCTAAVRGALTRACRLANTSATTTSAEIAVSASIRSPSSTAAVDDPSYFRLLPLLKAHRRNVAAIPLTPGGPDTATMETVFAEQSPRVYLTIGGLNNPTGASLSPAIAHRVLKLAERHKVVIVEDEIFADFEPGPPGTRLAAFDRLERVIQVGSYSKTISAALRCGYLALRPDWVDPVVDLKLATALSSSHFAAAFLHRMLTEAGYRRRLSALRARLADAMGRTLARLRAAGLTPWIEPHGGLFVWARLPDGLDAVDIARRGLAEAVAFAPGPVFSAAPDAYAYLRFNAAASLSPRGFGALERAMAGARARAT
jgi:DNA-binding transcriptional MocR family regulator